MTEIPEQHFGPASGGFADPPDSTPAPRRSTVGASFVAIASAAVVLYGAWRAQLDPPWGHVALAAGMIAFSLASWLQPPPGDEPAAPEDVPSGRAPLVALVLLAAADAAFVAGWSDVVVLAGWTAGCVALIGLIVVSRLRRAGSGSRSRTREHLAIAFLAALAAIVNLYRLADFPRAVHGDVGEIALAALGMNVPSEIFRTTSWWGMPGMHNALQRLGFLFADGVAGARATDAILGVLAVIPLAAVVRRVGGLDAAIAAGVLAIGSANMINTWRLGVGLGPPPFLALVALWAFLRGASTTYSPRDYFLVAGLVAGLSLQVNLAARIIPPMLACFAAHELAFGGRGGRRRVLRNFGWTVLCAVLVAAPLLWHYVQSPEFLQPRSDKFVLSDATLQYSKQIYGTDSALGVVWAQIVRSFGMFHFFPEGEDVGFFVGEGGFFELPTAVLFLLGVSAAVPRLRDRRYAWPLTGCILGLLLVAATIHAPSYHRAGPAAALALAVVGIGAGTLLRAVDRLCAAVDPRAGRAAAAAVAAAIAVVGFGWGTRTYFLDYCQREWKLTDSTEIARRIAAEPAEGTFTYLMTTPVFDRAYGNIRFMARRHAAEDLQPGDPPPTTADLHPGVNLFIALPHRVPELRALARALPPGQWEKHYKRSPPDELEFLLLRIRKPSRDDGP
jgi:hypothetical protein